MLRIAKWPMSMSCAWFSTERTIWPFEYEIFRNLVRLHHFANEIKYILKKNWLCSPFCIFLDVNWKKEINKSSEPGLAGDTAVPASCHQLWPNTCQGCVCHHDWCSPCSMRMMNSDYTQIDNSQWSIVVPLIRFVSCLLPNVNIIGIVSPLQASWTETSSSVSQILSGNEKDTLLRGWTSKRHAPNNGNPQLNIQNVQDRR